MPTYEYKCKVCNDHFDIEQKFTDDTLTSLAGCSVAESGDHELKKIFSAVGISFKGEGFYKNDSRSESGSSIPSTSSDPSSKDSSKSDSSSSDSSSSKSDSSSGTEKPSSSNGSSSTSSNPPSSSGSSKTSGETKTTSKV